MSDNFKAEATNLVEHYKESVEYFLKFGNTFERAIAKVFPEASKMKF